MAFHYQYRVGWLLWASKCNSIDIGMRGEAASVKHDIDIDIQTSGEELCFRFRDIHM